MLQQDAISSAAVMYREPIDAGDNLGHGPDENGNVTEQSTEQSQNTPNNVSDDVNRRYSSLNNQKHDSTVVTINAHYASSLDMEKRPSARTGCWKARTLQFAPFSYVLSAVAPDRAGTLGQSGSKSAPPRVWRRSWIRFGPLSGIFCMFLAAASIIASLGILAGSDKQPVPSWSTPPSTYLAILTALANLSMRYATIQGVVIAWWLRAFRGSTMSKLHWDWRSGTTLLGALTAGRHVGLLGLACIFSTVVVIDGPLLQRSSTVKDAPLSHHPLALNVSMAPELPREFTGHWTTSKEIGLVGVAVRQDLTFNKTIPANTGNGSVPNDILPITSGNLLNATRDWLNDSPIRGAIRGCPQNQVCRATLRGPALFPAICTNHILTSALNQYPLDNQAILSEKYAAPLDHGVFLASLALIPGDRESINVVTGFATFNDNCEGTFNLSICTLVSAIGEYHVTVHGEDIVLDPLGTPTLIALANNTASNDTYHYLIGGHKSTLAGVVSAASSKWSSSVSYWHNGNETGGASTGSASLYQTYQLSSPAKGCPSFGDPQPAILNSLNKYMLYAGALAAQQDESYLESHLDQGLSVHSTAPSHLEGNHSVFHTDYWYFLGAALVELLCIALVAPTYWGWWRIGRPVSFSPLELAKSFESPLLADCNSNSSGRDLANAEGEVSIRYGVVAVEQGAEKVKLAFSDPKAVDKPQRGMRFDI